MPLPPGEPDSPQAVTTWISKHVHPLDAFAVVYRASNEHRESHGPGCTVHPTGSGPLLGVLAAAAGARRILEVGCGLGYSALWLALGSAPAGRVETVEADPEHADLARLNFERAGCGDRVQLLLGEAVEVLSRLSGPYDLIFSDSDPEDLPSIWSSSGACSGLAACSSAPTSSSANTRPTSRARSRWPPIISCWGTATC